MPNLNQRRLEQSRQDALYELLGELTADWWRLCQLEQELTDALVPYRSIIRAGAVDESFVAGQMCALQSLVRGLRERSDGAE